MKYILFICLMSLMSFSVSAETVVFNHNETHDIVVGKYEVIIFDQPFSDGTSACFYDNGERVSAVDVPDKTLIKGPATITVIEPKMVTYKVLNADSIAPVTTFAVDFDETKTVNLAADEKIKLYRAGSLNNSADIYVTKGGKTYVLPGEDIQPQGVILDGPLSLVFNGPSQLSAYNGQIIRSLYSYMLLDETVVVAQNGYINTPIGAFEIVMEKSTDLTTWEPVVVHNTDENVARAFYRIRILN